MSRRYEGITAGLVERTRQAVRDDRGIALATVVSMSAILFMLVTVLLLLSSHLTSTTQHQTASTKAMHMADAGLNAYLYELRRNPTYYATNPTLGPTSLEDGTWTVTAESTGGPGAPVLLSATGSIPSMSATRTVVAQVRFPSYAEYMFLTDADINIGSGARILGTIRSNGQITNAGTVTGDALARRSITENGSGTDAVDGGPRRIRGTRKPNQTLVDFNQVTADLNVMLGVAQADGTYYGSSGAQGYQVVMSGTSVVISKVTGGTTTGNLTTTLLATVEVPAQGVLYFNDNVWVRGTYATKLTIVAAGSRGNIYVKGHIMPSDEGRPFTCGLIAENSILVPSWYPTQYLPTDLDVQAALLALNGGIEAEYVTGQVRNSVHFKGAMAYRTFSGFALSYTNGTVAAGYNARTYEYDKRLEIEPPPYYPRLRDGSLKVSTWFEDR